MSVYEDKIVIFNMGEWPKRVPTDYTLYQKHESVPHNPKIADVLFRSGDVEAWGRGFLKIKAECIKTNTVLPSIDTFGGGVSITIYGCEKYLKLLRYPEKVKPIIDDTWFVKENESLEHSTDKLNISVELLSGLKEYLKQPRTRVQLLEFCGIKSRTYFTETILNPLLNSKKIKFTDPDKPKSSKQKYIWNNL